MTIVALMGDVHGNRQWTSARLMSLGERGIRTVLQVGDFGVLWPDNAGKKFIREIDKVCGRYGVDEIRVVPGNHEGWGSLKQRWDNPKNRAVDGSLLPLQITDHITVLPRGHRFEIDGRTAVALGGAPSLDYAERTEGRNWWPSEIIEPADVAHVIAGGPTEIFLSHDAPGSPFATPKVRRIIETNPMGWPREALEYAKVGRERVTEAFVSTQPHLAVHGHFHVSDQATVRIPGASHDTRVISLDCDGRAGNVRLLDLETLTDPAPLR
jgi:hypothetical protein